MKMLLAFMVLLIVSVASAAEKPLALHPDNPHYFLFRNKPTVLVTSAEHYGAVLNSEFDYVKYLEELKSHGLNATRIFTGVYCEDTKSFGITRNTLAPREGKLLCPWSRSETQGYAGGGNKFDLTRWDDAYFQRLKVFLEEASKRGIVVEVALFCPFYEDSMWNLSPMKDSNNVNGLGDLHRESVYSREKNGKLQAVQEQLVRKIVEELKGFDNLYWEICNEPYFGGVTDDWQRRMIDVIVEQEKAMPTPHLISLNVANGSKKIVEPHPAVSIFNFHYTSPPTAVAENYALNKVIGENETGFKGTGDTHYRMEAWEFLLAGGGAFNNLDYSFVAGHEDGSFAYPEKSPGGGNRGFRKQMSVLKQFLEGFDFVKLKPDGTVVKGGLGKDGRVHVLSEPGKQYAMYFFGGEIAKPQLALPKGNYVAEWISTLSGEVLKREMFEAKDDGVEIVSPKYEVDVALRISVDAGM